jgi:hypothetical protein
MWEPMRTLFFISVWLLAGSSAGTAPAADLARIDRSIDNEPVYESQAGYCLLVFGPDTATRVWLVRDGDVLYVDRNGNGDLTEPGEQFTGTRLPDVVRWPVGDIVAADETVYGDLVLEVSQDGTDTWIDVNVAGRGRQAAGQDMFGRLVFGQCPEEAPVVHLGGPLQLLLDHFPVQTTPPRFYIPIIAVVGTPGEGVGTFAVINPDDLFDGAKFACAATFSPQRPDVAAVQVRYDYDCY